jgi:hypothetical protein
MVKGLKQRLALLKFAHTIEAHCVQSLENITFLTVARGMTVFPDKTLNFLEPGDDAFFAGRSAYDLLGFNFDTQLGKQGIVLFSEISHL